MEESCGGRGVLALDLPRFDRWPETCFGRSMFGGETMLATMAVVLLVVWGFGWLVPYAPEGLNSDRL
jgi:hypothetical protein